MSRSAAAYQKFTEDEIRKANSVDILSLARGYGYEPEKAGRKAVHMKHSGGLYIFPENNRFFQWTVFMAKGNNIHDEIKEQRKKLKDLSFSDKIKYIWSYYWIPIVGVVLAVIFAVSLISSIVKNNYDTVCFVAVLDGKMTGYENDTDILTTGLTDYLGIDGKKEQVDFSYTFSLKEVAMDQEAYVSANKLYTYASTGSLDGYLSEREYIDYFCTDKDIFFCDLRDIFSDEELEQLDDYIVYFTNTAGETYPIAVDITEAPVIKDSDLNMKDPCYGVVSSSKYQTNAADFIRYIFNMKTA